MDTNSWFRHSRSLLSDIPRYSSVYISKCFITYHESHWNEPIHETCPTGNHKYWLFQSTGSEEILLSSMNREPSLDYVMQAQWAAVIDSTEGTRTAIFFKWADRRCWRKCFKTWHQSHRRLAAWSKVRNQSFFYPYPVLSTTKMGRKKSVFLATSTDAGVQSNHKYCKSGDNTCVLGLTFIAILYMKSVSTSQTAQSVFTRKPDYAV
jgi:hypothetical protein